jgi:hypothetical protein
MEPDVWRHGILPTPAEMQHVISDGVSFDEVRQESCGRSRGSWLRNPPQDASPLRCRALTNQPFPAIAADALAHRTIDNRQSTIDKRRYTIALLHGIAYREFWTLPVRSGLRLAPVAWSEIIRLVEPLRRPSTRANNHSPGSVRRFLQAIPVAASPYTPSTVAQQIPAPTEAETARPICRPQSRREPAKEWHDSRCACRSW